MSRKLAALLSLSLRGNTVDEPRQRPDPGLDDRPPGMPRWVKVMAIVAVVVAVLVVVALLIGGEHSPARHFSGSYGRYRWRR